ncbi:UDP-N-acetylmuramate dehydrogenase [Stenomitos frigidus]|uniref:UDP-N-acetylenolpyruvoylglucosamine reductase n=1 Tax=Stenomitos frigidus ULC18 TaxID=2107698 RepID=A0A2T1DTX9_9CYAN|nr:UDP-N-acetylmuramate dehydrogenase [Stenomitos frigidus]PSB23963.1 UDP-N-acetylenolpyruvoylglucosamine reductase [Stenomitos frigidus ULC18]
MTLSYDPPKVAIPGTARLSFESLKSSAQRAGTQPIRLSNDCIIKPQVSLAAFTSFRVGGPAQWYVAPKQFAELQASFDWAHAHDLPVTLLGAGSNLLISDRGLPGLVISTRRLRQNQFDPESGQVTVGAGEPLPLVSWHAAERGLQGLEWAVGIPGTIGGAVVMNAGAHGGCTADYLVNAQVLLPDGTTKILTPQELHYRYRSSALQGKNWLVTQATFQLQPGFDPVALTALTSQHYNHRRTTQPYHLPSCGSVFRNPSNDYKAGWLIEQAGLKGYQIGGAQIAERHANFILNCGNAMASDIFRLIRHAQHQVEQHWSLQLVPEVRILGDFQAA